MQGMVGKKTTLSMLKKKLGRMATPLRSDVGGSGGQKGKYGMTPAKSTAKRGGRRGMGHHKSSSTMSALSWGESTVSPSMNRLLQKRLYHLAMDNVKALGKERLALKKRLASLESVMKDATATAMMRNYQLRKAKKGGSRGGGDDEVWTY